MKVDLRTSLIKGVKDFLKVWFPLMEQLKRSKNYQRNMRYIFCQQHNKALLKGGYLIDDRRDNGASEFEGKFIHFGSDEFKNWEIILGILL